MSEHRRPERHLAAYFDALPGAQNDPAALSRIAHNSAHALLSRVRNTDDPGVLQRILDYTDEHGIDAVAELWSQASPYSLPGALWRIYLIRALIGQDAEGVSLCYRLGVQRLGTIDPVVAGAQTPTGPAEIMTLAEEILRGVFRGDFALALERAVAFCRLVVSGSAELADGSDLVAPSRAAELTRRAARLSDFAAELTIAARLWREESLE